MHNTSNGPDPIPKAEGEGAVASLYNTFGVPSYQNIAYAEINVGSIQDELIAVSGASSPAGTVPTPTYRLFDTFDTPPGYYRGYDSEVKLLEAIARELEPNAQKGHCYAALSGSVRIYSHITIRPCCDGVIAAFRAMFPKLSLSVSNGT